MIRAFLVFALLFVFTKKGNSQSDTGYYHSINLGFGITGKARGVSFMPSFDIGKKSVVFGLGPVVNILPSLYTRSYESPRLTGVHLFARNYIKSESKFRFFFQTDFIGQRFSDTYLGYTNIQNLYELYVGYGFEFGTKHFRIFQNAGAGINRSIRLYENSLGLQTRESFYNFGLLGKLGVGYKF